VVWLLRPGYRPSGRFRDDKGRRRERKAQHKVQSISWFDRLLTISRSDVRNTIRKLTRTSSTNSLRVLSKPQVSIFVLYQYGSSVKGARLLRASCIPLLLLFKGQDRTSASDVGRQNPNERKRELWKIASSTMKAMSWLKTSTLQAFSLIPNEAIQRL
jgi:hypothetical protein